MPKKQIAIRLTHEALDQVKELIEHYQGSSVSKVTQTDVIEFAVRELYKQIKSDSKEE